MTRQMFKTGKSHPQKQHLSRLEKALGSEANVLLSEDSGLEGVFNLETCH